MNYYITSESTTNAILTFFKKQGETLSSIFGISLDQSMIFIWIAIFIIFLLLAQKVTGSFIKWGIIIFLFVLALFIIYT
ncbi:MAG: hypothetical protein PHU63_04710 [Candidatus ainarchaeum sp.]|nr:hypothetical protein [Candidatus ainarchaeum sp.]